jgi:NAD(P)-dependent dehydrogenase (short-subunit alcohol dehydrogenase family)
VAELDGRTVIITGAARGLGREYADLFAADGARVVLADVDESGAAAAARELERAGHKALGVGVDITAAAQVGRLVGATLEAFGSIDVLVNNAAVWGDLDSRPLLQTPPDYWSRVLDINLTGALICSQAVVPEMARRRWGRILNISSIGAWIPGGVYGVSKIALNKLTLDLAHEVGGLGITCNAIAPGPIFNEATRRQISREYFDRLLESCSVKRSGTARDMYSAMRWLCRPDAEWVTGQVISPNGGFLSRL